MNFLKSVNINLILFRLWGYITNYFLDIIDSREHCIEILADEINRKWSINEESYVGNSSGFALYPFM